MNKIVGETSWMSLYETENGYTVAHEKRCGGHIVAVFPYRKISLNKEELLKSPPRKRELTLCENRDCEMFVTYEFLLREEVNPAWGPDNITHLCGLTGGCEKDQQPTTTAVNELREEAGYEVGEVSMIPVGVIRGSKGMDTYYHLYLVDLTDKEPTAALEYDGPYEKISKSIWTYDIRKCVDPLVFTMFYHWAKRIL